MNNRNKVERILFYISRFVSFYLVITAIIISTLLVFLRNTDLNEGLIRENVSLTLLHTIGLTIFGCVLDEFRRRQTLDKTLRRITAVLDRLAQGDFSVRLDEHHKDINHSGFQDISRRINRMAQELSGVETLRSDFIASVSHEMKTPLAVVRNYATLLRDESLPSEKRQEYIEQITDTTQRLADLISNILKLNKLENQQIFPEVRVFDLGEQLAECILAFETAWDAKNLELVCNFADDVFVEADPELLQLVWNNLLSNAIKFTPEGGKITVELSTEEKWACVKFIDTGCGMSPETGAHIFEKFYQGDTAHATQGNGLGLALVKRVVDITGGVISVASAPGKGSVFTVRMGRIERGSA